MKKTLLIALICFLQSIYVTSGQSIPIEVKKTVAFIYAKNDSLDYVPLGTGFFIAVRDTATIDRGAVYFVTSKHVIQKPDETYFDKIHLRVNTKDSLSTYGSVDIKTEGKDKTVYFHSDPSVDIAVIPINPNIAQFDVLWITEDYLTSKEDFGKLNIKEGSNIFFTGMFTPFMGTKRIYPIVRFGRVALITEEKIPWDKEMTQLYLVESSSYGGNSGSPVFFYLGSDRGDGHIYGGSVLKLAGIMKGYFGNNSPIKIIETKKIAVTSENMGISAVVPSYLLQEILFSEEIIEQRGF